MKYKGVSGYHGNNFKTEKPDFAIRAVLSGEFSTWKDDRVNLLYSKRCALLAIVFWGSHTSKEDDICININGFILMSVCGNLCTYYSFHMDMPLLHLD